MDVLIAEDSVKTRQALVNIIRFTFGSGVTLHEASNGMEALEHLYTHDVQILLTDIMMPKLDGFRLIEKIRSDARFAKLFIVVITGLSGEEHIEKVYKSGADYYVAKPIHQEDITARLKLIFKLVQKEQEAPRIQRITLNPFKDEALKNFYTVYAIYQEEDLYQLIEHINKLFSVNDSISVKDLITIFIKSYEAIEGEFESAFEMMLESSQEHIYITTMSSTFIDKLKIYEKSLPDHYAIRSTPNSMTIQIPIYHLPS